MERNRLEAFLLDLLGLIAELPRASQEGGSEAGSWLSLGPKQRLGLCNNIDNSVEYSCHYSQPISNVLYKGRYVFCCV